MAKKYLDFEGLSHFKGKLDVVLAAIDEKLVEMYYKKSEVDTLVNTEKTRAQGVEQALQNEILGQTGAIQTAISNANAATAAANTAAAAANNVNATLNTTTNVVTITDRTGTSKSVDLTNKTNVELEGSVITVTDKDGNESEIDLLDATNERVYVNVTTNKEEQSVAGLVINCFLNNDVDEPLQATTNANGQCYFDVPNNYHYRLVFPTIAGCDPITDVTHIAHASQRIVDVEYKVPIPQPEVGEQLMLIVEKSVNRVHTAFEGVTVGFEFEDGTPTEYRTTDASGKISIIIPFGKEYTIAMPKIDGWHLSSERFHFHLVAEQSRRSYVITYDDFESGVFIITNNGDRYSLEDFEAARELPSTDPNYVQNSDAKVIIVETDNLENVEDPVTGKREFTGVFGIDIDFIRTTNLNATANKKQWCYPEVLFDRIPTNGNNVNSEFYYDGYGASVIIHDQQTEKNATTVAVNHCLEQSMTVNGVVHPGFLGSVGQWQALELLKSDFDSILESVRPREGYYPAGTTVYTLDSWKNTMKWTSTQHSKSSSWLWVSGADYNPKSKSYVVLPFFAF